MNKTYYEASVNVIVMVLLGRFLEHKAKFKARNAIETLMNLTPKKAILV